MKDKAQDFLGNLSRKRAVLGVAVVLFVAGGTATALDFFGTATGDVDVDNQAVSSFDVDASYDGSAAPVTDYNTVEVTNNNDDRFVSFNWTVMTSSDFGNHDNAYREVYKVQNFKATSDSVEEDVPITVTPNVDEVKYHIDLPSTYEGEAVTLEYSGQDGENQHVGYYPAGRGGDGWFYQEPSSDKSSKQDITSPTVDSVEEVRRVGTSDTDSDSYAEELTIVVKRSLGYQQTFGVNLFDTPSNNWRTEASDGTDFSYSNTDQSTHLAVDTTDYLGSNQDLEPSETVTYNVGAFLDSSTPSDETYTLAVGAEPVTQ